MATAISSTLWDEEEDLLLEEGIDFCEQPQEPQGANLLIERHRQRLQAQIEHAKGILDEEITAPYSDETLDRATSFIKTHIEKLWETYGAMVPIPMIGPGPDGSVDLYWKQSSWQLLVNIPALKDKYATFYRDDYGQEKTKGSFDPTEFSYGIAAWLMM
jgi:hypothetical protein